MLPQFSITRLFLWFKSFNPSQQPLMSRPAFSYEMGTAITFSLAVGLTEGSVIGILAKKTFDVSPLLFAVIMASGALSNITSFLWARVAERTAQNTRDLHPDVSIGSIHRFRCPAPADPDWRLAPHYTRTGLSCFAGRNRHAALDCLAAKLFTEHARARLPESWPCWLLSSWPPRHSSSYRALDLNEQALSRTIPPRRPLRRNWYLLLSENPYPR